MNRAIVFAGTFDPVHSGHVAVALQVLGHADAEAVWFVPAGLPPLRGPAHAPFEARLALLRAATAAQRGFAVLDIEARRGGVSYTVDTMAQLHHEHPGFELPILLGADVARSIQTWHRAADLLAHEQFLLINRTGVPPLSVDEAMALGYNISRTTILMIDSPPVSASDVRQRVAARRPLDGLVPPVVADLIARLGLYQSSEESVHNAIG
jgi:nicotinate-nucleotide adenylyltransferase